jgi:hypothetical protein
MNETREAILLLAVDRCNMTAVRQFIEVGASIEITVPEDGPTATALHSCVLTREIAQLLIDNGVEISRANESEGCCCGRWEREGSVCRSLERLMVREGKMCSD